MFIPSRTPEGQPFHCPLCGREVRMESSPGSGDAVCPHCGQLLWQSARPPGTSASWHWRSAAVSWKLGASVLILAGLIIFAVNYGLWVPGMFGLGIPETVVLCVLAVLLLGRRPTEAVGRWIGHWIAERRIRRIMRGDY